MLKLLSASLNNVLSKMRRIVAFDIGRVNFAYYVEEVDEKGESKCIQHGKWDISGGEKKGLSNQTRLNLIERLDYIRDDVLEGCTDFVIEMQFNSRYGGQANITAIKISEVLLTYLLMEFPKRTILLFPSRYKTQLLGAPKKMTKPQRKKWAVDKADEILNARDEKEQLFLLRAYKKRDDVSDCVIMCQAYKLNGFKN